MTFTPGDAAACSRMPTVISLTYSDLTHAVFLTLGRSLTRAVSLTHAASHTRCPFHTRSAGKHASLHTRDHTTHTRGHFHTRGLPRTRGLIHTWGRTHTFHHTWFFIHTCGFPDTPPFTPAMRALQHAFCHTRKHTHRDIHHGDSRHLFASGFPGPPCPPKLSVHLSAALAPSTPRSSTGLTWS